MVYFSDLYLCIFALLFVFTSVGLQEDPVLLVPEDTKQKPYVAIIKVIRLPSITGTVSLFPKEFLVIFLRK